MKVYKLEVMVIDHDEMGVVDIINTLENTRYPNWCMSPRVQKYESADIGEWRDDHPLNFKDTRDAAYDRLFPVEKKE